MTNEMQIVPVLY